jgi:hypothetical protein
LRLFCDVILNLENSEGRSMPQECRFDEEFPMTLQIGMLASDGWILASDRRSTQGSGQSDGSQAYLSADTRKIELKPMGTNIAYACAGSDAIRRAGAALAARFAHLTSPWSNIAIELAGISQSYSLPFVVPFGSHRLIVVFFGPEVDEPQLWVVNFKSGQLALPEPIGQWALAGDFQSGARLLPQLYYSPRTCAELIRLAAFTIFYAHLFNPSGIAGLDILVGQYGTAPRFLSSAELDGLRVEFDRFDDVLARHFGTTVPALRHYRP